MKVVTILFVSDAITFVTNVYLGEDVESAVERVLRTEPFVTCEFGLRYSHCWGERQYYKVIKPSGEEVEDVLMVFAVMEVVE